MNRLSLLREALRVQDEAEAEENSQAFAEMIVDALGQGTVFLELSNHAIRCDGADVLSGDLVAQAVLEGLRREGVERVVFEPTAKVDELVSLGRLLAYDWREKQSDEKDLEAEAWRIGFANVHLEIAGRTLVTEADREGVEVAELGVRLVRQLGIPGISDDNIEGDVGEIFDQLRALPEGLPEDDAGLLVLKDAPTHKVFASKLSAIAKGADVTDHTVGACLMEAVRLASSKDEAREVISLIVGHLEEQLSLGRPEFAVGLARRLLVLASPVLLPSYPYKDVIAAGLRELWSEPGRAAMLTGMRVNPSAEAWKGALFTLGELATAADLAGVCALGGALEDPELRQPLADALLLLADRVGGSLRKVLYDAHEDALPVILLATRRRPDATLVEPLLARVGSANPTVREAVLLALRDHQSARIKEVMRAALDDEAKAVRLEALRYLAVYRDGPASEAIVERLNHSSKRHGLDADELRALAISFAVIRRGEGAPVLEELASVAAEAASRDRKDAERARNARLLTALIHGLRAAGKAGRAALERLGRSHPELRDEIRQVLGGTR